MEHTELSRQYQKREGRRRLALALLIAAIVALGLWFITLGTASTGPGTVLRAVSALLSGTLEGAEEVKLRSRQYAKRQLTWFRRNHDAHWFFWDENPDFSFALTFSTELILASGLQ